ncbi:MAG: hypothetical protein DRQ40_08965 [Gammaproteobacteria bacterium]|nr:MAG: hypothetical protein DRQ40_08965 [Gammaproteobacteria bacterium]
MPGQGFFKRGLSKLMGLTDEAKPTPRGPDTPEPAPAGPAPTPEAAPQPQAQGPTEQALGPTPTPVNPQAGQMQRDMTMADTDEAIQEVGAQGEMGAVEGANVQGRNQRRNINLDFYEDDSTKRTIELFNRKAEGYKDNPARAVQTHEETIAKSTGSEDAEVAKTALERILGGKLTDKFSPEDLVSVYHLAGEQAEELHKVAADLKARRLVEEIPAEEYAHFKLLSTRLNALLEVASVRGGEAGRMLNAMQAISKLTNKQYLKEMQDIVKGSGGRDTLDQTIDAVAEASGLDDIASRNKLTWQAKAWNTALQVRYNFMLSSVRTHAANIGGSASTGIYEGVFINSGRILLNNAEFGTRAIVNATFKGITGNTPLTQIERAHMSEAVSLPWAMIKNFRAGLATANRVYTGKEMGHGKLFNEQGARATGSGGDSYLPGDKQVMTRALEAEDMFYKTIYGNAQIEILAKRAALAKGGTTKQINEHTKYLMTHPTEEMMDAANAYASKLTFTSDPSIYGGLFKGINEGVAALQKDSPLFKVLIPFRNTPINITGYVIDNTPIGKLIAPRKLYEDLKNPATRHETEARIAISSGLMAYAHSLWEEGKITGASPDNYGELRVRQLAGWEPNAIITGGKSYTLNRMDPAGLVLGIYATYFDARASMGEKDQATAAAAAVTAVASLITDRSMLAAFGDLERVFSSSEGTVGKAAGKLGARMLTGFAMPSMMRDFRERDDPRYRAIDVPNEIGEATWEAFKKTIYNAVPGFSEQLPPKVDAFGADRINTAQMYYRGILPVKTATIKQDKAVAALIAMDIPIGQPDSVVKLSGLSGASIPNALPIDLLAVDGNQGWVYRSYQQAIGKARQRVVERYVSTPAFQKAIDEDLITPDGLHADKLRNEISKATRATKAQFILTLMDNDSIQPTVGGEKIGKKIKFTHQYSKEQYKEFARLITQEGMTQENRDKALEAGYKPRYQPPSAGLPKELQLQKSKSQSMPRF